MSEADYFCPHCGNEILELHDVSAATDMLTQEIEALRDWQEQACDFLRAFRDYLAGGFSKRSEDKSQAELQLDKLLRQSNPSRRVD